LFPVDDEASRRYAFHRTCAYLQTFKMPDNTKIVGSFRVDTLKRSIITSVEQSLIKSEGSAARVIIHLS